MTPYIELAHELADASASVIRKYFRQTAIEDKPDQTPVTIADKEAEQVMRVIISRDFPEHGIIGEENGSYQADAEYVWVLDPIDGTRNFMTGQPIFGTLIALMHKEKVVLGVMNQPITRERWVSDGKHTQCNDTLCQTNKEATKLEQAIISTTSPYLFAGEKKQRFENVMKQCRHSVFGSDCYAYAMLSSGHLDLVIESGLKLHDIAALIPIIEAAGGVITDWQGQSIGNDDEHDVLVAANKSLHAEALAVLNSPA